MLTAKSISWERVQEPNKRGWPTNFYFNFTPGPEASYIWYTNLEDTLPPKKKKFGLDAKNLHSPYFQLP